MADKQKLAREAYEAVQQHGGLTAASKATGVPRATLWHRCRAVEPSEDSTRGKWRESRQRDEWVIECSDSRIRNEQDAIKKAGVDMALWYVHHVEVTGWDVTMKLRSEDGDAPHRSQNQRIKVVLRRKLPKTLAETIEPALEKFRKASPAWKPKKYKTLSDPHMLEVGLYDAHFGKMAWQPETGTPYKLDIADRLYRDACDDLLNKSKGYNIEKILLPIGNDFFHFCNEEGTTEKSRNVLDVDGRLPKIMRAGIEAVKYAVERCREVAPVDLLWVPGNHDVTASLWLCEVMSAYFHRDKAVTVDTAPTTRKAVRYGVNLIGLHHGDGERSKDMPVIIMSENRDKMEGVEHIEIHGGHFHRTKRMEWVTADTFPGDIVYRTLPSLSGRDAWHYRNGYGSRQAAEAYLFSRDAGYTGHFCAAVSR